MKHNCIIFFRLWTTT